MHNDSHGRMNGQSYGARDGMIGMNKFHVKFAYSDFIPWVYCVYDGAVYFVLLKLIFNKSPCQAGAVYRGVYFPEHIGQRAYMVLVPVRYKECLYLIPVALQIGKIGYH